MAETGRAGCKIKQTLFLNNNNKNNSLHLYSAFLSTQSALHCEGGISSSTTSVQHPPGWCDGSHSAPDRSPHTSLLVERRQSDEANQCMGMIRRPLWSEANGQIWPGCRGHTSTLFERHPGIFNDHRESGPRFNVSSEGRCFLTVQCLRHYTGALGPTQTTGWAPPAGLTNTSSSSNLVFTGGLPSRYWPGSALLSFSGQPVLGCRVIWLPARGK